MTGILYGIGVGPGEAELMTIKAVRTIEKCQTIILPTEPKEDCYAYKIVKEVLPSIDEKELLCKHFPMIRDQEKLEEAHNRIYSEIKTLLEMGKNVAFLTIGDPAVYSTYGYIQKRAIEDGMKAEMISGVPSFCAVASRLGISLGDSKDAIHIIPGSMATEETLQMNGTKVYMKSGKQLTALKEILVKTPDRFEVYGVANCGLQNEKVMFGLEELDVNSGYLTIVIVKSKNMN